MNKKEQKLVEDLKIVAALRWTDGAEKDIPKPRSEDGLVSGYVFNSYSYRVEESCSNSVCHGRGRSDKTTSQNPIEMFSSRLLALKAMRHEVELRLAIELRKIDLLIEKELG